MSQRFPGPMEIFVRVVFQTEYALQFTCGGVDVDIMFSYDWDMDELNKGGYNTVYDITSKTNTKKGRQW